MILLEEGEEKLKEVVNEGGGLEVKVVRKGMKKTVVDAELERLQRSRDVALGKMLRCRVRYFTDGAVIGSGDLWMRCSACAGIDSERSARTGHGSCEAVARQRRGTMERAGFAQRDRVG